MTVQNIWPLIFLICIPLIILLYLLKQKVKDEPFSSTMLWQEIYRNLEARTPFEKFKHNILMYLQMILALLLILALMAPMLKRGGLAQENIVLVLDNSASMEYQYNEQQTRLAHSIQECRQKVDELSENAVVTLITCDSEATVVYQGTDKTTLKLRLSQIETTLEAGTLTKSAGVVNSVIANKDNVEIICYTDTDFESEELVRNNKDAALTIENMYSEGENCSLDYVNYSEKDGEVEALCKITNYGETEVCKEVNLYADGELVDIQSVTIKAQASETVYFKPQKVAKDKQIVLQAEISEKDSLLADNVQKVEVKENGEKKVLLLSEGNVFLEKALSLDENSSIYKAEDINVLKQQEDLYDLYVFDGIELDEEFDTESLPKEAAYLFLNYDKPFGEKGYITKEEVQENVFLTFCDSTVTQYVKDYCFGVTKAITYALPEWGVPFLKNDEGKVVGYTGQVEGHHIGVIGFDLHNTDLALQTEFPIFMSQLSEELFAVAESGEEIVNFPVSEESDVIPAQATTINENGVKKKTGGRAIRNWILMMCLVLLVVEWIVYTKQVHSNKKKQFLVLRGILMLVIILAMSGLSITKKQKKNETIFLVDVSDSMAGNRSEIEAYIAKTIGEMPENNLCGIVAFGRDTAVDQFLSEQKVFSAFTVNPVTTATNIEKAVQNASNMFDEGAGKHLILITDGSENEGSMSLAASTLKGKDIEFYAIQMQDDIAGNEEVYIDNLTTPNVVHIGDHYNVTVSVVSNVETQAVVSLYAGRNLKQQQEVQLNKGINQFVFEDIGEEGTIAQYKAVIEPENDTQKVNNTYVTFAEIEASPRVLLVEGKAGEAEEFEKVLSAANIQYDTVTPKGVPVTVAELNQYKAVITLDVHYDDLRKGFAKGLQAYVKDYSGGYICIGGENSYALGNYRNTELEEILPVNMDLQGEKEIPKMLMTMVIDQSGSMSENATGSKTISGLDLAKQAAMSGVEQLRATDEVAVLAFDDKFNWVIQRKNADDIIQIQDDISTIGGGGGTSIYPAFQEACLQTIKSDAKIKHIILLTDGQDEYRQYDELIELVNQQNITVSTVAVGSEADYTLLEEIAERCGGRAYYTDIDTSIPRIFAQEVYLSTNTYLINEVFYPSVVSENEMITAVLDEGCPAISGYIAATAKQNAEVVLESDEGDPILSTWQYGLGRTVAWNSDGNNEWTAEFAGWENYPMLWSNIINYVISDTALGEDNFEIVKEGNTAKITYETKDYNEQTKVMAAVTDEEGNLKEVVLDAVKPGVFETTLDMNAVNVYSVNLRNMQDEEVIKNYNTAYANQYSEEYRFCESSADFETFLKQAGGKYITMEDDVWTTTKSKVKVKQSLTIPLLIFAVIVLLIDIFVRRFAIDMVYYIQKVCNICLAWLRKWIPSKKTQKTKKAKKIKQQPSVSENGEEEVRLEQAMPKQSKKQESEKIKKAKTVKNEEQQNSTLDMNQLLKKKRERE